MTREKQLAITKHPPMRVTYCVRAAFASGATVEYLSVRPLTFEDAIRGLEQRIIDLRRMQMSSGKPESVDAVDPHDR